VFIAEPQTTNYDVHFRIGKIPVRVHPLFWVITLVFGALNVQYMPINLFLGMALWTAAVSISILVHELGHALVAKAHGWPPRIVLYGMGGLAVYSPGRQTRKSRILIDAAGPAAGFVLGGLVLLAVVLSGHSVSLLGLEIGSGPNFAGMGRAVRQLHALRQHLLGPDEPAADPAARWGWDRQGDHREVPAPRRVGGRAQAEHRHRDRGRHRRLGPVEECVHRGAVRDARLQQLADASASALT
jgi:hypothetical protein